MLYMQDVWQTLAVYMYAKSTSARCTLFVLWRSCR